jgi:hypothetical protein
VMLKNTSRWKSISISLKDYGVENISKSEKIEIPESNWGMFHLSSGKDQENSNRMVGF